MKITAPAGALARALSFVGRAAAKAATQPVLTSALFEAEKDTGVVRISATDNELSARIASSGPTVEEGGRAALPCRVVSEVVKSLGKETSVTIEANEKEAALATADGKHRYALRVYPAKDFPETSEFPEDGAFELEAATLSDAISRIAPAASADTTKPTLTGVLLSFSKEEATLVATDSYRLAIYQGEIEGAPQEGEAIVPARALKEVARLCQMGPEKIDVAITDKAAMFRAGGSASGVMFATRLISGSYPDYKKLLPPTTREGKPAAARQYAADGAALIESLERVSLFSKRASATAPAPITLSFTDAPAEATLDGSASLAITAASEEVGSGAETIAVEPVKDTDSRENASENAADGAWPFEISFNPEYLLKAVRTCHGADSGGEENSSGKVLICMDDPLKPALVRPAGDSAVSVMAMPMRNPELEARAARERQKNGSKPSPARSAEQGREDAPEEGTPAGEEDEQSAPEAHSEVDAEADAGGEVATAGAAPEQPTSE